MTLYLILGYPIASPICKFSTNGSIAVNTTSGSPHDFRKGDPEFFGWRILRVALEIAEPCITEESGLFQECGWNRAYKK